MELCSDCALKNLVATGEASVHSGSEAGEPTEPVDTGVSDLFTPKLEVAGV